MQARIIEWLLSWGLGKVLAAIKSWYDEKMAKQQREKEVKEIIGEYKKALEVGDEQAQRDAHKRLVNKLQ